jgi:2,5-dihydroxypyridine 5,6-dioxygenase
VEREGWTVGRLFGAGDLADAFRAEFELCRVRAGELVAIVTEPGSRDDHIEASWVALMALGANPWQLRMPSSSRANDTLAINRGVGRSTALQGNPAAVEGLKHSGARMLTIMEPPEILLRMTTGEELRQRVERAAGLLEAAREMHITSRAGTDLRVALDGAHVILQYGYTDQPGRWDHWPGAFVAAYPDSDQARGRLVLDVGDFVFPLKRYVESPISFDLEDGFIRCIQGEGLDAYLLRDFFKMWNDPAGYGVSHVGFGLHEAGQWNAGMLYDKQDLVGMDLRSCAGNFMFSNGPNRFLNRLTPCHCDMPMRGCNVYLDDEPVILDGQLVRAELLPG